MDEKKTSDSIGNVIVMLEAFVEALVRGGFSVQAMQMKGIEIFDMEDAETALHTLYQLAPSYQEADTIKKYVIAMLEAVLPREQKVAC